MRFENPLLLAVVGLAVVLSMILPWLRQWLERRAGSLPEEQGMPEAPPNALATWRRGEPRWQSTAVSEGWDTRSRRGRSRLGSRRDLRHAVVLMTILEPCRALERDCGQP
jgi:hypothetical protein